MSMEFDENLDEDVSRLSRNGELALRVQRIDVTEGCLIPNPGPVDEVGGGEPSASDDCLGHRSSRAPWLQTSRGSVHR